MQVLKPTRANVFLVFDVALFPYYRTYQAESKPRRIFPGEDKAITNVAVNVSLLL